MAAAAVVLGGLGLASFFIARSVITEKACNTSSTCPKGYSCSFNRCVRTAQCLGDADCTSLGMVCIGGFCAKPPQCSQDLDCKGFPKEVCDPSTRQCVAAVGHRP